MRTLRSTVLIGVLVLAGAACSAEAPAGGVAGSPAPVEVPTPTPSAAAATALPAVAQDADTADGVARVLRAALTGEDAVEVPEDEGCRVVVVDGAELAAGDLDVYVGWPGGECGGDAAGTQYRIRQWVLEESGSACVECDWPGAAEPAFDRLRQPYEGRDTASSFTVVEDRAGGWRLAVPGQEELRTGGTPCGPATHSNGDQYEVFVVGGDVSCADAGRVLGAYWAAPDDELQGNYAFWTSPDGWTCSSPTAATSLEEGIVSSCSRDGVEVDARLPSAG